jgi:hypothetical protein
LERWIEVPQRFDELCPVHFTGSFAS